MVNKFYLGGAQSFLVKSISVPTYVLLLHVAFMTKTPVKKKKKIKM